MDQVPNDETVRGQRAGTTDVAASPFELVVHQHLSITSITLVEKAQVCQWGTGSLATLLKGRRHQEQGKAVNPWRLLPVAIIPAGNLGNCHQALSLL